VTDRLKAKRGASVGLPENAAFAIMMALAAVLSRDNPLFVYPAILWAFLAFFILNYLNFALMPGRVAPERRTALASAVHVPLIFLIVSLSGGSQSYFWVLYLYPIFSAALILETRGVRRVTVGVAVAVCLGYRGSLQVFFWPEIVEMLIKAFALIAAAAVTARFADGERRARRALAEEHARTERERAEMRARIQHLDRLATMGTLMASITHELKGPLSAILSAVELVTEDGKPKREDFEHAITIIDRSSKRCRKTIQEMLAFSRKELPKQESSDLNALLRRCVELKRYDWVGGVIELEENYDPALPKLEVSGAEIEQVVFNIISNAEQAIRSVPGAQGRIGVRSEFKDGLIRLCIEDNGPGVPSELSAKVWEPFFTTKPSGQGTGLGLSISRGIIEAHGGTLQLESRPGRTVFTICLPGPA